MRTAAIGLAVEVVKPGVTRVRLKEAAPAEH